MQVDGASLTSSPSDNFTDAQHKKQDEKVTQDASDMFLGKPELTELIECAALLERIIDHSGGKIKDTYRNTWKAIQLMREHDELVSALKEAWMSKNYKEIRESGELRASLLASS
jgi:hypothetical protein